MTAPREILVATHNSGKLEEFRRAFAPLGLVVRGAKEFGLEAPEESAADFVGNALLKARAARDATGLLALADDSGLCVDILGGAPGVATADWTSVSGGRDAATGMSRLAAAISKKGGKFPSPSRFMCVLALAYPDGRTEVAEGQVSGSVVWPPRGTGGHGFDPMFEPDGEHRTFAEMSGGEKDAFSHRGRALEAILARCFT